jgi:hypothetical protein
VEVAWQVYLECLKGDEAKVVVMVEGLVITLLCTRTFKGKREAVEWRDGRRALQTVGSAKYT